MSEQNVNHLVNETGCDSDLAKLILQFTGNDLEGALKILKSVDKNIYIIRMKFIAQTNKIYGSSILLYDSKTKTIERFIQIIKREDKKAIEFDFDKKWDLFYTDIEDFARRNLGEIDLQAKLSDFLKSAKAIQLYDAKLVNKKEIDEKAIKSYITDTLVNITGDINVAVKLKFEKTDPFEINKGHDAILETGKTGSDENDTLKSNTPVTEKDQIILLTVELDISPVEGVPLSELTIGDLVAVFIKDERPIAEYIAGLLIRNSGMEKELEEKKLPGRVPVYAELKDVKVLDTGILIRVEFGPGIYGHAYYGEDVKVKSISKTLVEHPEEDEPKNNFIFRYFWLLGGILLCVIIIVIILFTLY